MSKKQLRTAASAANSSGLEIVRKTSERMQASSGMRQLFSVGRTRWPSAWQAAVDAEFERVTECAEPSQLFAALAREATAMGMICPRKPGQLRSYDVKELDTLVRARVVIVAELDRSHAAMMASEGVVDFVTPATPWPEVVARLQLRLYASYVAPFPRANAVNSYDQLPTSSCALGIPLTGKEHQVYIALARQMGEPVSRAEILRSAWNRDARTSAPTNIVDVYISYLRQKLDIAAPHLEITAVRGIGYVLRERAPVVVRVSHLHRPNARTRR